MPESWPGRKHSRMLAHGRKADAIERAVKADIVEQLGPSFDARRFLPYVQMHEFEALLFAHPETLSRVMRKPDASRPLQAIREEFDSPERINDDPNTAPSKRIQALFPDYRKPLHGAIAAGQITVELMRAACPHFHEWLTALERLGDSGPLA